MHMILEGEFTAGCHIFTKAIGLKWDKCTLIAMSQMPYRYTSRF